MNAKLYYSGRAKVLSSVATDFGPSTTVNLEYDRTRQIKIFALELLGLENQKYSHRLSMGKMLSRAWLLFYFSWELGQTCR